MSCRVAMLRMQDDGLFKLPPSRKKVKKGQSLIKSISATDPQLTMDMAVHSLPDLRLELVSPIKTNPLFGINTSIVTITLDLRHCPAPNCDIWFTQKKKSWPYQDLMPLHGNSSRPITFTGFVTRLQNG